MSDLVGTPEDRFSQNEAHRAMLDSVSLQAESAHYYGFVYFRQTKDKSIRRGYFQKVRYGYSGNKLEGDWGEIVALGAKISPLKESREKWSLPKKKKKKKFFFFFFF